MPAGSPDGGQWTSGETQGTNDNSDTLADHASEFPIVLAEASRSSGRPIDLEEERQLGGHAIEGHVNKSPAFLLSRARDIAAQATRDGFSDGIRVGSFSSLEAANKLVNATVAQNQDLVDKVIGRLSPREELDGRFSSPTGYEAYARNERSQPYLRETYGVTVVIVPDGRVAKGYRVDTAFPRNFDR